MKIVLKDFIHNGEHVDEVTLDMPQRTEVDELFVEKIGEYIGESLEVLLKKEES